MQLNNREEKIALKRDQKKAEIIAKLEKACEEADCAAYEKVIQREFVFILGNFQWYVEKRIELELKYPAFVAEYNKLQGDR